IFDKYNVHIHVPEGATPKDGPSAGITMATTIASILSNKEVKSDVAMTGELTLTGKVLPIGGLKEKLIAAHKAKMKLALIPRKNFQRDLDDIPLEVKENMEIKAVDTIEDVLKETLI
ncbi:MAG: S16 family serine protease, partial [Halarcobacter sp.]